MQEATKRLGRFVLAFLFGSEMCFSSEPSGCPHFLCCGSHSGAAEEWKIRCFLAQSEWKKSAPGTTWGTSAPNSFWPWDPTGAGVKLNSCNPVEWIVDPQDWPLLSVDLLVLHHTANIIDAACVLIAFSPVNSSICNWKRIRGYRQRKLFHRKMGGTVVSRCICL